MVIGTLPARRPVPERVRAALAALGQDAASGLRLRHQRVTTGFELWHLEGLPAAVKLHHFTAAEGPFAHDHFCRYEIEILAGGYDEEAFTLHDGGNWSMQTFSRCPGDTYAIEPQRIHRIARLHAGDVWTLAHSGPVVRKVRLYEFAPGRHRSRQQRGRWSRWTGNGA